MSKLLFHIPRFNSVIGDGLIGDCLECTNFGKSDEFPCDRCFEWVYGSTTSYFMQKEMAPAPTGTEGINTLYSNIETMVEREA